MTHRTRRQRARRRACRRHRRWRRALAAERRRRARKFRNAPIARLFFALPLARRPESRAHPRASNALAAPCSGAHRRQRKRRRRGVLKLVEATAISCVATSKMRKLRELRRSRRVFAVGREAVLTRSDGCSVRRAVVPSSAPKPHPDVRRRQRITLGRRHLRRTETTPAARGGRSGSYAAGRRRAQCSSSSSTEA